MEYKKIKILNAEILAVTQEELLRNLKKGVLVTPNVDHIMKMQTDRVYYDIVHRAEWCICDSRILYLCAKMVGQPLPETISGSSFFPTFCEYHREDKDCRIFLLGAMDNASQRAMERINEKMGRRMVVGAYSPSYGFEKNPDENHEIARMINESGANVVLVGVGCPKQEKWIDLHKTEMPGVDIWMALGATIDFEAGKVKRAPKIYQKLYLEWFYRFLCEPKRLWHRYFVEDMPFFWLLLKERMGLYKNPFE